MRWRDPERPLPVFWLTGRIPKPPRSVPGKAIESLGRPWTQAELIEMSTLVTSGANARWTPRVLTAFLVVALSASAQGVNHDHASTPDAAQCAVCHVEVSQARGPASVVAHELSPVAVPAPPPAVFLPVLPSDQPPPAVRGPPSNA